MSTTSCATVLYTMRDRTKRRLLPEEVELIKLAARIAVADYLGESASAKSEPEANKPLPKKTRQY